MTVAELMLALNDYDGDTRVVIAGYEGGVDDLNSVSDVKIKLDGHKDSWWFGNHEVISDDDPHDEVALLLGGLRNE